MANKDTRDAERAAIVKRTARITGLSTDTVYAVLATDRENEIVEEVFHAIVDANKETDNKLIQAVKKLVPLNP